MELIKKHWSILLLLLALIPSVWFLFLPGFFESDDGEWMIIRFSAFYQVLSDGQFPVRFLSRLNFGYGYPVANFLYPGFMYLATPIKFLGFGFVDSIKIVLGASVLLSGTFIFFWLKKLFGTLPAFFGSIYYVYAPYHLYDLTRRGSVGEILSLSVMPFALWSIDRKSIFWGSFSIAILILSHNTLALVFLSILVFYFLIKIYQEKKILYQFMIMLTLGLGMSSFFWFPALYELRYVVFGQTQISDWSRYFVNFELIGISTIVIFITAAFLFLFKINTYKTHLLSIAFLAIGLGSIFLAISQSIVLWQVLPVSFVQFPFRFLSVTILSGAVLSAFLITQIPERYRITAGVLIAMSTIYFSRTLLFPTQTFNKGDLFYSTNEATTTVRDEYMPKWVKIKPDSHFTNKIEILDGETTIIEEFHRPNSSNFIIEAVDESTVRLNTIYYPGWVVEVNGQRLSVNFENEFGVMDIRLPVGKNTVEVKFTETPLRLGADLISFLSLFTLLFIAFTNNRFKVKDEN